MSRSPLSSTPAQLGEINRVLAGLAPRMATAAGGAAIATVAQAAVHHIGGARWASVSMLRAGRFRTLAATAPVASRADALQHDLAAGPAVDPAPEQPVQHSGNLAKDRRWPAFAQAAQPLGVAGLVSCRLPLPEAPGATVGLTLYADVPDAFDGPALWAAGLLAAHCVQAVSARQHREQLEQREQALGSAHDIGTAAGVLMARHGLGRQDAAEMLRATAHSTHRALADVAAETIDAEVLRLPPMTTACGRRRATPDPAP